MYFILVGFSDFSLWLVHKRWQKSTQLQYTFQFYSRFCLRVIIFWPTAQSQTACTKFGNWLTYSTNIMMHQKKIWFINVMHQNIFCGGAMMKNQKNWERKRTSKQVIIFFGRKGHFSTLIASLLALLWPEVRRQVWKFKPFVFTELFTW